MSSRRTLLSAFVALFVALPLLVSPAQATTLDDAKVFIQSLGQRAIDSLTGNQVTNGQRQERFRKLLDENFDIEGIGKFVLGRHWRQATPDQQKEYMQLFEQMVINTYAQRFGEYSGEKLKVDTGREESGEMIVNSQVVRTDGPPLRIDWRLRTDGASFRILDVIVEGVSMSVTQRSEFASIIQRGGGGVESLLAVMREKTRSGEPIGEGKAK